MAPIRYACLLICDFVTLTDILILQVAYNGVLRLLRKEIGYGYLVIVKIDNTALDPVIIDTLNSEVNLVSVSPQTNHLVPDSFVEYLIAKGFNPKKIILEVPLPPVLVSFLWID